MLAGSKAQSMVEGLAEECCSPHGSQGAEREERSQGHECTLPRHTLSDHLF